MSMEASIVVDWLRSKSSIYGACSGQVVIIIIIVIIIIGIGEICGFVRGGLN